MHERYRGRSIADWTCPVAVLTRVLEGVLLMFAIRGTGKLTKIERTQEVEDGSAWLKIGIAIRLAYQLRLHNRRKGPLPADELEARMVLDRERTWFCLICG